MIGPFSPRGGRLVLAGLLLATLAGLTVVAAQTAFEKPAVLRARDLAPPDQLRGPRFQVDDHVTTDGLLAKFTIKSDFGPFEAEGPGMLQVRVREIQALDALSKMEKSDVFKKAMADSAKRTGKSLATAATHPVETVKGIPAGVGRFFERVGRDVKTGTQQVEEVAGQGSGQGGSSADAAAAAGQGATKAGESVIGVDEARRRLAKELKVDPYTTNPVLAKKLDEFAWVSWSGQAGLNLGIGAVPGGTAVKFTRTWVSDLVWDLNPGDLRVRMDKQLKELGVAQDAIDRFLRQKWFTLTTQTALVEALASMGPGPGRPEVINWALTAESVTQTRFMAAAVGILADYQRTAAPLRALKVGRIVLGETQAGGLVIPAPVDYMSWTERIANFVEHPLVTGKDYQLWLFGRVSPRTREELTGRGWTIREGVAAGILTPGGPTALEKPAPQL